MVMVVGIAQGAKKTTTCMHCASQLEYVQAEVLRREGKDISGGPDGCEWIICPACGSNVILKQW